MSTSKWALGAVFAAIFSTANAADPDSVALTHYEPLQQLELRPMVANAANAAQKPGGISPVLMRFDAMGKGFDLQLEPNNRLLEAARQNPLLDGVEIYRGELAGRPGSWARIVVADGVPRGMFWDGQEMYAIEAPGDSLVASSGPVIFRLADMQIAPGAMSCGSASMPSASMAMSGADAVNNLMSELYVAAEAQGAISEIEVGAIGDSLFVADKGGDTNAAAAITARLNNVDGIYSAQLGIQITVPIIETFDAATDPISTTRDPGLLLDSLSAYRAATPAQSANGLTHLYTGRDLMGTTVGIAWTGSICSTNFGAGLSEGNDTVTFDSLVAAHEIGHNFGAPHDGEAGSACESVTGDFIMTPQLSGAQTFSQCSIDQMNVVIARDGDCITALPTVDMQVSLTSSTTVLFGADATLSYDVVNNGSIDASAVTVDFTLPPNLALNSITASAGTCTSDASTASCDIGDVPGFTTRTVDIETTPTAVGAGTITATVSAAVDERPENDQEALQLSVDPAVDLVVNTPTGSNVKIGNSTTITTSLENRATMDATGVDLTIDLGSSMRATAASWSGGSCSVATQRVTCQAATFAALSNSSVSLTAEGVSEGTPRVTATLSSVEADLVPGNNTAQGRFEVRDPEESGAGSTGPAFLLLMGLAALWRRRS